MLVPVEPIFFISTVRIAAPTGLFDLSAEIGTRYEAFPRVADIDIVQPKLRLIIADQSVRLVPVRDVNIRKSIVVEINHAATPGPSRPRDRAIAGRGLKTSARASKVEAIPKCHLLTHRVVAFEPRP